MPLGFGSSRQAGRLEVEVAADTDDFDKAMKELPRRAKKAGDEAGAAFTAGTSTRMKLLKGWLAVNAVAIVGTLAFAFRDKLNPVITATTGKLAKLGILMNSKVRKAIGLMARGVSKLATTVFDFAEIGLKGAGRGLQMLGARLKQEGVVLNGFGHAVTVVGHALEKLGKIAGWVASVFTKFKLGLVAGLSLILIMTTRAAGQFENTFARVRTLLKGTAEGEIELLGAAARRMSNEIGISSKEINDTLYQTLSALPQLAQNTKKAMEVVAVAAKVAATGFAEAEVAVRAVTGIMNAWKLEAESAVPIADALFAAQDQGVTTFGEMAASIGQVSGLTAALGGDWRDLLAIVATNTPFISTSETITGIASALSGVLEQGAPARAEAERLGLEFSASALKAKGLIPFLREVAELTEGDPEIIAKLFGRREAVQLVVNLSQNMETLNEKLQIVRDTTGSLEENLRIMNSTVERQGEIMKTRFSGLLASLGLDLDRWKVAGMEAINSILLLLDEYSEKIVELNIENAEAGKEAFKYWELLPRDMKTALTGMRKMKDEWPIIRAELERGFALPPMDVQPALENLAAGYEEIMLDMQNQSDETALLTAEILRKSADGVYDAWAEPPDVPVTLERSVGMIDDLGRSLRAVALFEWMDTGDIEAYNAALEASRVKVNNLILAERNRLIAAGVETSIANKLLDSWTMADDAAKKAAEGRAEAASKALAMMIRTREVAEEFGALGLEGAPEALRPVIAGINKVDSEIQRHAALLKEIKPLTEDWYAVMDRLGVLQQQREALRQMGQEYGALLPLIETFGREMVDLGRNLPVEEQQAYFESLFEAHTALAAVARAQTDYNLAVSEFGVDSDEAREKLKALKAQIEIARATLLVMVHVMKALSLSTDELYAALDRLDAVLGGLGDPGTTGGGGIFGWLANNAGTVEGIARGLLSVADAIGEIGEEARRSLQGVIDLSTGLGAIAKSVKAGSGIPIGGAAQAIGGAIGLISGIVGLFGESEEARKRREQLEANTAALRRLTASVDRQRETAQGLSGEDRALLEATIPGLPPPSVTRNDPFGNLSDQWRVDEFERALREAGMTVEEYNARLREMGLETQIVTDNYRDQAVSLRQLDAEYQQVGIDRLFAGVAGEMDRLALMFQLKDFEPVDKLKAYYEVLKNMTGLDVPDFDLDTAEGRAALEAWVIALFDAMSLPGFEGDLGTMSPEELLALVGNIEGLVDTIDEGPDAESFQEFKGITEVTANRLAGIMTTNAYWNEITALNVRELVKLGGGVPLGPDAADDIVPNDDRDDPDRPDLPRKKDFERWRDWPPVEVDFSFETNIATLEVNVVEAQDMDADQVADAVVDKVGRTLGNELIRQQRSGGRMLTRTVR